MNLFLLFSDVVTQIKSGEYKAAACTAGRIVTTVTCATQGELLATAHASGDDQPTPLTPVEFYNRCAEFSDELRGACEHSEGVCRMGAASNAELAPGNWDAIKNFILDVLKLFVKKPADWTPAPLPVPSAEVPGLPSLVEPESTLPKLSRPSSRPASETAVDTSEGSGSESEGEGDEPPSESTDDEPEPEPEPKPSSKPKSSSKPK